LKRAKLTDLQVNDLEEFISTQGDFDSWKPIDQICLLIWFAHSRLGISDVNYSDLDGLFHTLHLVTPALPGFIKSLAERKPPKLIKNKSGFKLHATIRKQFDLEHGDTSKVVAVTNLLRDLPDKLLENNQRMFLVECLDCYKVSAFRAATVMAWNLTFSNLLEWIFRDTQRLADFNAAIVKRYPKINLVVKVRHDFEELKEDQIIEICNTSSLISSNVVNVLKEKLKRRNTAAHPSANTITQAQADDTITDLVNNVILPLI